MTSDGLLLVVVWALLELGLPHDGLRVDAGGTTHERQRSAGAPLDEDQQRRRPLPGEATAQGSASFCPGDASVKQLLAAQRVAVVMRTSAALLLVGLTGALAASASAQTNDPSNPTAPGPVPPSVNALFPPAGAGCGENGLTRSQNRPTVRLTSTTFPVRGTNTGVGGRVRIPIRATQTAASNVKIAQVGGKRVGGTIGGYICTEPTKRTASVAVNGYGAKLVKRHGRLAVKVTFRLINGSGVTHTRVWSGVIRPEKGLPPLPR